MLGPILDMYSFLIVFNLIVVCLNTYIHTCMFTYIHACLHTIIVHKQFRLWAERQTPPNPEQKELWGGKGSFLKVTYFFDQLHVIRKFHPVFQPLFFGAKLVAL